MTSLDEILDQIQYLFKISGNEEGVDLVYTLRNHLEPYTNECEDYRIKYEQTVSEMIELQRHLRELEEE